MSPLQAAGEHGMRHSLPNARIMIHQPSGGARGQATDIQIQAEEIIKLKHQLNQVCVDIPYPYLNLNIRFESMVFQLQDLRQTYGQGSFLHRGQHGARQVHESAGGDGIRARRQDP